MSDLVRGLADSAIISLLNFRKSKPSMVESFSTRLTCFCSFRQGRCV